jgi:large subunit ribosomal protein L28
MARTCDVCGKGRLVGHNISHSNIKTKRVQQPNLKTVRIQREGRTMTVRVCTRCLRSGRVIKAP